MIFVAIALSESSAARGPKKTLGKNVLLVACIITLVCTIVAPWEALPEVSK
jgi:hypothetical protein